MILTFKLDLFSANLSEKCENIIVPCLDLIVCLMSSCFEGRSMFVRHPAGGLEIN